MSLLFNILSSFFFHSLSSKKQASFNFVAGVRQASLLTCTKLPLRPLRNGGTCGMRVGGAACHSSGWYSQHSPPPLWFSEAHGTLIWRPRLRWGPQAGPHVPRKLQEALRSGGSACGPWSQGAWGQLLSSITLASFCSSLCLGLLICAVSLSGGRAGR